MIVEQLYDALMDAGVSKEKALAASAAVADFQEAMRDIKVGFADVKVNFAGLKSDFADLKTKFEEVKSVQRLHSWMLTTTVGMLIALMFKVFSK